MAARCATFGDAVDLIAPGTDGARVVALTPPQALHGVRVEYFDAAVAAQFLGYLRSRTGRDRPWRQCPAAVPPSGIADPGSSRALLTGSLAAMIMNRILINLIIVRLIKLTARGRWLCR